MLVDGVLHLDLFWGVYVDHAAAVWLLVCLVVAVYGAATLSNGRLPTPGRPDSRPAAIAESKTRSAASLQTGRTGTDGYSPPYRNRRVSADTSPTSATRPGSSNVPSA